MNRCGSGTPSSNAAMVLAMLRSCVHSASDAPRSAGFESGVSGSDLLAFVKRLLPQRPQRSQRACLSFLRGLCDLCGEKVSVLGGGADVQRRSRHSVTE